MNQKRTDTKTATGFAAGSSHLTTTSIAGTRTTFCLNGYGQAGDLQAFGDEVAAHRPEPESSIFYFEIVGTLTCYCTTGMDALGQTSWPRTKQGYANMHRLYGTSNLKANRFAFLAYVAKDKSAARDAFASITAPELSIWTSDEVFDSARAWAADQ